MSVYVKGGQQRCFLFKLPLFHHRCCSLSRRQLSERVFHLHRQGCAPAELLRLASKILRIHRLISFRDLAAILFIEPLVSPIPLQIVSLRVRHLGRTYFLLLKAAPFRRSLQHQVRQTRLQRSEAGFASGVDRKLQNPRHKFFLFLVVD